MWAASAGTIAYCSSKVRSELDDRKVPLMGVLGAFIFAAQMINFTIPATGSSGHLGGGLILAVLLGPHAAFLTIASVLMVQALFFADGGLLALGCNIFNLGFFPAFIAYPFIYRTMIGRNHTPGRIPAAAMVAAIAGLQLGAFGVVMQTVASGISALPFTTFVVMMLPIHLAIGIVEGLVTTSIVTFVYKAKPEIMPDTIAGELTAATPVRKLLFTFLATAILLASIGSWFASKNPDGLEWAISRVTGQEELPATRTGVHGALASLQEKLAFLPDYSFRKPAQETTAKAASGKVPEGSSLGTSLAGLIGGVITLVVALLGGYLLRRRMKDEG
jgi:cobalt/nickel transport system permease protein